MLGPILSIVGHAVVDVITTVIARKQKEVTWCLRSKMQEIFKEQITKKKGGN